MKQKRATETDIMKDRKRSSENRGKYSTERYEGVWSAVKSAGQSLEIVWAGVREWQRG